MIEYVDLLYKLLLGSFWCYDKLQLLQWLWIVVGYFSVRFFDSYFALWRSCYFPIGIFMIYCCSMCDHDALISVLCFIDTSIPKHVDMFMDLGFAWGQARSKIGGFDTSILHHAFMLIFIALWTVIILCGTILMPFLSYFARFIWRGRIPAAGILDWKRSKSESSILHNSKCLENQRGFYKKYWAKEVSHGSN